MMKKDALKKIAVGWLVDGSGADIKEDVLLEVKDTKIQAVKSIHEQQGNIRYDHDFRDYTVLPALADSHVHLTWSGVVDPVLRSEQRNAPFETAHKTISCHLKQHFASGVLAVRDGGDKFGYSLKYKNEKFYQSQKEVYIGAAGTAWHAPGRYGSLIGKVLSNSFDLAQTPFPKELGNDHLKIVNSGLNSLKEFAKETLPQFGLDTLKHIVDMAHAMNLKVMVHANGSLPVQTAIAAGCDSIEHGFFMGPENLALMAEKRTFWVPTAVTMQALAEHLEPSSLEAQIAQKNLDHQLEQLALARKFGVLVAAGTDAGGLGVDHGTALSKEVKLLLKAGFQLKEAVSCASRNSMRLIGLDQQGTLTKGMQADFIAFKGAPHQILTRLHQPDTIYLANRLE